MEAVEDENLVSNSFVLCLHIYIDYMLCVFLRFMYMCRGVRFLLLQCYSAYVQKRASSFSAFSTFSVVMDTHTEYVTIVLSVIDSLSWDVVTSLDRRDFFGHSEFFLI